MQTQTMDPAQATQVLATMIPVLALFGLVALAAIIVPLWVAFKKAGLAGPLALLVFIPFIGPLLTLYVLAFAKWKVVPAPEYGGYPPQYPGQPNLAQQTYSPAQYGSTTPATTVPAATGYAAPGAYAPVTSSAPGYPPPPSEPGAQR